MKEIPVNNPLKKSESKKLGLSLNLKSSLKLNLAKLNEEEPSNFGPKLN